ncbi:MAG: hypothetical protein NTX03_00980 [Bacteroidetes bacterium]|nr:hypothetical protein [Bacteroidota bacterium]
MKLKGKLYLILVLIASCYFLISCEKDKGSGNAYTGLYIYRLDDEIPAYVEFPVGSYWVYNDSLTGERDSVRCIATHREVNHTLYDYCTQCRNENIFITFRHYTPRGDSVAYGWAAPRDENCVYYEDNNNQFHDNGSYRFTARMFSHVELNKQVQSLKLTSFSRNLRFYLNEYINVLTFSSDSSQNSKIKEESYAERVGVISRRLHNGKYFILKRYHINW